MKRANLAFAAAFVPLDYLALLAAGTAAYSLRFASVFTAIKPVVFTLTYQEYFRFVLPLALVYVGIFALSGLYAIRPRRLADEMIRLALACSTGIAAVLAIAFFSRELFESRFIVLAGWGLSILFVCTERIILRVVQRWLRRFGVGMVHIAIIGKTKTGNDLKRYFERFPQFGFLPVIHLAHFSLEASNKLRALQKKNRLDAVLFANTEANQQEIRDVKTFSDTEHVGLYYSADPFVSTLRPLLHTFAGHPVVEVPKTPLDGWGAIYKRGFDIVVSLVLIIVTIPLQVLIALAIILENPGPVFFQATRVGVTGKNFSFLKFRSMVKDAHKLRFDPAFVKEHGNERDGTPLFKLKDDPRVTGVGKFLRAWSLDEIPQFYLVLAGQMSLVGPRPHLPEEVALYKPEYKKVLTIKPGITGMAQVGGRASLDFPEEVALDMYYIENWSPWLDFVILLKTPWAVVAQKGAY